MVLDVVRQAGGLDVVIDAHLDFSRVKVLGDLRVEGLGELAKDLAEQVGRQSAWADHLLDGHRVPVRVRLLPENHQDEPANHLREKGRFSAPDALVGAPHAKVGQCFVVKDVRKVLFSLLVRALRGPCLAHPLQDLFLGMPVEGVASKALLYDHERPPVETATGLFAPQKGEHGRQACLQRHGGALEEGEDGDDAPWPFPPDPQGARGPKLGRVKASNFGDVLVALARKDEDVVRAKFQLGDDGLLLAVHDEPAPFDHLRDPKEFQFPVGSKGGALLLARFVAENCPVLARHRDGGVVREVLKHALFGGSVGHPSEGSGGDAGPHGHVFEGDTVDLVPSVPDQDFDGGLFHNVRKVSVEELVPLFSKKVPMRGCPKDARDQSVHQQKYYTIQLKKKKKEKQG